MKTFDRAFSEVLLSRLEALPADTRPLWGQMNRGQLIGHLASVLPYTLGKGPDLPFKGNFVSRTLIKFLILSGVKQTPRNIRLPRPKEVPEDQWFVEAPIDSLRQSIDFYLAAVEQDDLPDRMHPFFGLLTGNEWRRLHRIHFLHHMNQFGIGQGL